MNNNQRIGSTQIKDLSISEGKLSSGAVSTNKIQNLAVTTAKLANECIVESKIYQNAVTNSKLHWNTGLIYDEFYDYTNSPIISFSDANGISLYDKKDGNMLFTTSNDGTISFYPQGANGFKVWGQDINNNYISFIGNGITGYNRFEVLTNDNSDDNFGQVSLSLNPEEGFSLSHSGGTHFHLNSGSVQILKNTNYLRVDDTRIFLTTNEVNTLLLHKTSNYISFTTNSLERMRIISDGNVGIGTTSPVAKLEVVKNTASSNTGIFYVTNSNAGGSVNTGASIEFRTGTFTSGATPVQGQIGTLLQNGADATFGSDMVFYTSSNAVLSEKMRILRNGNIGIGTTIPAYHLDIRGGSAGGYGLYVEANNSTDGTGATLAFNGHSSRGQLSLKNLNAVGGYSTGINIISADTTSARRFSLYVDYSDAGKFKIGTDTSSSYGNLATTDIPLTIDINKNVGINNTSPAAQLDIVSAGGKAALKITHTASAGCPAALYIDTTTKGDYTGFKLYQSGGSGGYMDSVIFEDARNNTADAVNSFVKIYRSGALTKGTILQVGKDYWVKDLVVDYTGNVGMGTVAPDYKLDIQDSTVSKGLFQVGNAGNARYRIVNSGSPTSRVNLEGYSAAGDLNVFIPTAGDIYFIGGKVGIGTTNPGAGLNVISTTSPQFESRYDSNSNAYIKLSSDAANAAITINKNGANRGGSLYFNTGTYASNALAWGVGMSDSDCAGDGTEFYIGQTAGGANASLWIETNGNVGIGTTGPILKTDIMGAPALVAQTTSGILMLQRAYNPGVSFGRQASFALGSETTASDGPGRLDIKVNPASSSIPNKPTVDATVTIMTLLGSGKVGVGVIPSYKLDVQGTSANTTLLNLETTGANNMNLLRLAAVAQSGIIFVNTESGRDDYYLYNNYGNFQLYNADDARCDIQVTHTGDIYLCQTSGNVGIGTTSLSYKLTVNGNFYTASTAYLFTQVNGANAAQIGRITTGCPTGGYGVIGEGFNISGTDYTYRYSDTAAKIDFASGSFLFSSATAGTGGNTITWNHNLFIKNNGYVGFGTLSPTEVIEANGSIKANLFYTEKSSLKTGFSLASYYTGANTTGYLIIQTAWLQDESPMVDMDIDIYRYNDEQGAKIHVYGYLTTESNGGFRNFGYETIGAFQPIVRFARNTSTGAVVVIIGESNTNWVYSNISVSRASYSRTLAANINAWSISVNSDISGYSNTDSLPNKSKFTTPYQITSTIATGTSPLSVASTTLVTNLNADLLDGNHASAFATSTHTHTVTRKITVLGADLPNENTNLTIPDGATYVMGANKLEVYVNGVYMYQGHDYNEYSTTAITFFSKLPAGTKIMYRIEQ